MLRVAEQRPHRRFFDDPAGIHHRDAIRLLRDDPEVVGDEQQREAETRLQIAQQIEDLAWIVTSSAVVGSSAMSSFGWQASAAAINARWRRPPDS